MMSGAGDDATAKTGFGAADLPWSQNENPISSDASGHGVKRPMYLAVVTLTMLILPTASALVDHVMHPDLPVVLIVGRWFVFWGVGVRLALAGIRQVLQPEFTARQIFHMKGDDGLVVVRELGIANLAIALVALISLVAPTFVAPAALSGAFFYGIAGVRHTMEKNRSRNETIAMVSDLFLAAVLLAFLCALARLL